MGGTSYTGKAGHLAVMGELALRGYNVAMPEIDIGDDLFVVNDTTGAMWRVQVKTSLVRRHQKTSTQYSFRVKASAISKCATPDLHFVFVMRASDRWRFLVVSRQVLQNYVRASKMGTSTPNGDYRQFTIILRHTGETDCSGVTLTHHLNQIASK